MRYWLAHIAALLDKDKTGDGRVPLATSRARFFRFSVNVTSGTAKDKSRLCLGGGGGGLSPQYGHIIISGPTPFGSQQIGRKQ